MDQNPGKKDFSMEARLLLAFLLMGLVLFLTPYFYKPPAPPPAAPKAPPPAAQTTPGALVKPPPPPVKQAAPVQIPGGIHAGAEETISIDTKLYRVEFSNKGAVVRSWVLKAYKDRFGKPLELVNSKAIPNTGAPFSLYFPKQKPATDPNQVLFAAKHTPDRLGVDFEYSDGRTAVRKSFHFRDNSYLSDVSVEVLDSGAAIPNMIEWRGGFGDAAVVNAASTEHTLYYDLSANKLVVKSAKDAKNGPVSASGSYSFAGVEDTFFASVFLPRNNASVELVTFSDTVATTVSDTTAAHVGAGVGGDSLNHFALFVGPKDIDILRRVDPKLEQMVDWGWFGFLGKPLFLILNWTNDHLMHNYGWSIVLVTIAINMLLLPLKFTSMKSARKMQILQPQIQAINAKYKSMSMRDPRRSEQNQEIMELYKKHGANPLGGCLPMVLQIPFFFAFYKVLTVAIEMRGASWLWVADLSQPETLPIRILPVVLIVTQFISQRMTPATGMDPSQQKVMMIMPLALGFMFYYQSSGLVLYWLTGNIVAIVQQWFTNRSTPAPVVETKAAPVKKSSRN